MKFTADSTNGNVIRSYETGAIQVREETYRNNLIVSREKIVSNWEPPQPAEFTTADFLPALELKPEIILFGSGTEQQFPPIAVLTEIMQSGTAIEIMSTSAACRTFNILLGEQRSVVAALMIA